jgi:molybdenum cofactor cytidylyltransferase
MPRSVRAFAIVPAAGRSQRMGQPKLLLPWNGATVLEHVLRAWRASPVERVIIVVHPLDEQIAALAAAAGADVVRPDVPPSDMKASVRLGLQLARQFDPADNDAWLLAPADMPRLSAETIARLIAAYESALAGAERPAPIWVPSFAGRRGHPTLFAWRLAAEVDALPVDQGLNALLAHHAVECIETSDASVCEDLDTPDDYRRLQAPGES